MDAVQIKMGKGPRAAVVVDNGKSWAGNRVRAAKALCNALAERGFASAQPAGKGNQAAGGKLCGKAAAQGHGFIPRMGNIFFHTAGPPTSKRLSQHKLLYYTTSSLLCKIFLCGAP